MFTKDGHRAEDVTYAWKEGGKHLSIGDDASQLLRNQGWELDGEPVRTAEMFHATRRGFSGHRARFDVVGVDEQRNGQLDVEWIQDAFHP